MSFFHLLPPPSILRRTNRITPKKLSSSLCAGVLCLNILVALFSFPVYARTSDDSKLIPFESLSDQAVFEEQSTDNPNQGTVLLDTHPQDLPKIDGKAFILYDALSENFLVGDDCDTPLAPASTTKVLSIILALELLNLDDIITVTRDMYDYIPEGYVVMGLVEGEEITVRDAIYASLMTSANDACSALAFQMGGSKEGFSDLMNKRAAELGCLNTHFTNPFGYSDPDHTTTVHDMALIMQKALEFDFFKEASTTRVYAIDPTNKYSDKRTLNNGNRFISTTTYSYDKYVAGKTGYTDLSGHTIVAAAESDGRTLIGVIFGASVSEIRYSNLIDLFEYGFETYTTTSNDESEYKTATEEVIMQINGKVSEYGLSITDTVLDLQPYITVRATRSVVGYSTSIDLTGAVADPTQSVQILTFPIIRRYSDGTTLLAGHFKATLSREATNANPSNDDKDSGKWIGTIQKVIIVLVLIIIALIALALFIRIQRRRKAMMNRKRTRIL